MTWLANVTVYGQPKLHELDPLASRGECDQLFEAAESGLFFLSASDPSNRHSTIIWWEILEILPSPGLLTELGFEILGHLGRQRGRLVAPALLKHLQASRGHFPLLNQAFSPLDIRPIPRTPRSPRRESLFVTDSIDPSNLSVDPTKA